MLTKTKALVEVGFAEVKKGVTLPKTEF